MEPTNELVHHYWTNAPLETLLYNEIILFHRTIIIKKNIEALTPYLVQRLWTIVNGGACGELAQYIHEQIVFTVSSIPRTEKLRKSNVYEVVNELIRLGIVEKTPFFAVNPDPSYTGPKARFYKLSGYDLSDGWNNPLLKRAQVVYEASIGNSPEYELEQSAKNRLLDISPAVVDYYRAKEQYGTFSPKPMQINQHIAHEYPDLSPEHRAQATVRIHNDLCNTKEGSQ